MASLISSLLIVLLTIISAAESQPPDICPSPSNCLYNTGPEITGKLQYKVVQTAVWTKGCNPFPDDGPPQMYAYSFCQNGDFNSKDCKLCLQYAGRDILDHCTNKQGAAVTMLDYGGCCVRYETYNFCQNY